MTLLPVVLCWVAAICPSPQASPSPTLSQLYDILEVGRRALEVHGGPQCDLGQAVEQLRLLWQSAAADEAERQARRASIAAESRQRAQRLAASTPAQRLCKQLQVAYDSKLTKTRAMELFALEAGMLAGVPYESKVGPRSGVCYTWCCRCTAWCVAPLPFHRRQRVHQQRHPSLACTFTLPPHPAPAMQPNPRNPRFAPMRLYRAEDVAQRALRYRTLDLAPATPQGN